MHLPGMDIPQCLKFLNPTIKKADHFTSIIACLVAWPSNESEAGGDLVLMETSLLFLC